MSKLLHYPDIKIEKHENYQKGSYRNRCMVAYPNGKLPLSIPLKKGKNEQLPITKTAIAYDHPWQKKHWSAIRSAYGKAPFFEHYADDIQAFYAREFEFLFDFNLALLEQITELLQLNISFNFTNSYEMPEPENLQDFRGKMSPKAGKSALDVHFKPIRYPQVFEEKTGFLPNLSILDMLFCAGPESVILLEKSFVP